MSRLSRTLEWLYSLRARGEIYKLERMEQALKLIGSPHRRLPAVHIAGTKGKGSVAAMLDSCLREAGYRCGLYTKPHLVNLSERTRIDGHEIPADLMLDYIERLRRVFERGGLDLTFFEFTVALMFLYFAEANVDLAIIETGLGGRLDSTNVVTPLLSVITPIGLDHTEYLGGTLAEIAAEKAGIIKPGVPVIISSTDAEPREVLLSAARAQGSSARVMERDFGYRSHGAAHRLDYWSAEIDLQDVDLALAGNFQHQNAAIALATLETLRTMGWTVRESAIRRGLCQVRWPGRFDVVATRPTVVVDCAHNEMSLAALLEALDMEAVGQGKPRLIFACLSDKPWEKMAAMLAPRVREVTLTRVEPKRPLDPERLVPLFAPYVEARVEPQPRLAIERVMAETGAQDFVLVTGSVYLVGEIYPYFLARAGRTRLFP